MRRGRRIIGGIGLLFAALLIAASAGPSHAAQGKQQAKKRDRPAPGTVLTRFGKKHVSFATGAVALADGSLIVCGGRDAKRGTRAVVIRYTPRGKVDPGFGKVTLRFGDRPSSAGAVEALPDGRILVAGNVIGADKSADFAVARLLPTGLPDPSFGTGGEVVVDLGADDYAGSMAVLPDGKVLVAGTSDRGYPDHTNPDSRFGLIRLDANGALDPGFGSGGKVVTTFGRYASALDVAVQVDGKISVGGYHSLDPGGDFETRLAMARYLPDGSPDASFGQGETLLTPVLMPGEARPAPVAHGTVYALSFDSEGRLVMAADVEFKDILKYDDQVRIERYLADGAPDPGFGTAGAVGYSINRVGLATLVATAPDGKIGVATTGAGRGRTFGLTRLLSNGAIDTAFGKRGSAGVGFPGANESVAGMAFDPFGRTILVGGADPASGGLKIRFTVALARFRPFGRPDKSFGG